MLRTVWGDRGNVYWGKNTAGNAAFFAGVTKDACGSGEAAGGKGSGVAGR